MDDTVKTLLITAVGGVAAYFAYEYVLAPMIAGGTTGATTDPTAAPDGSTAQDPQGMDAAMYGDAASYAGQYPQYQGGGSYPARYRGGRNVRGYVNPQGQYVRLPPQGTLAYRDFMNTHYSARVAAGLQTPPGISSGYWGHQVNNGYNPGGWDTIHPIYAGGGGSPIDGNLMGLGRHRRPRQNYGQGSGAPIDGGQSYWDESAEEISGPNSLAQLAVMDEGSFSN